MWPPPEIMSPRRLGYFTPILWERIPAREESSKEWSMIRECFAAVREGDFAALDELPRLYPSFQDQAVCVFARNLLGDAGTDKQLEAVAEYVREAVLEINSACELCHSLGLWGRLTAIEPILIAYDRFFPGQCAEGLPTYLSTILEAFPTIKLPIEGDDESFFTYESSVYKLLHNRIELFGTDLVYLQFGEIFSVERTARNLLSCLSQDWRNIVMRPYLRQRFEASTGIDCSDFYQDSDVQPLTITAKLETWLKNRESKKFVENERYFFGHRIPR